MERMDSNISLPSELCQAIVDGILNGYKDYLEARRQAYNALRVSAAYAWTKGNHIDSSVYKEFEKYRQVKSSVEKAGYAWEYLQFILEDTSGEKYLIIVKNSRGIKKAFNGQTGGVRTNNYLREYAGINKSFIDRTVLKTVPSEKVVQLELPGLGREGKEIATEDVVSYDWFYIVTCEFDSQSKMISKIALTIPNQAEMTLIEVADLTPLIENSTYSISDEELEVAKTDKLPDGIYDENHTFGYEVASEKQTDTKEAN